MKAQLKNSWFIVVHKQESSYIIIYGVDTNRLVLR